MGPEGKVVPILQFQSYKADPGLVKGRLGALLKTWGATPTHPQGTPGLARCTAFPVFPRSSWRSWGKRQEKAIQEDAVAAAAWSLWLLQFMRPLSIG